MTSDKRSDLLKGTLQLITDDSLRFACEEPLNDTRFLHWPAAISMHHAYEGGLLAHTVEVAETALHIADRFPQVSRDVLIAAALWHDYGKIFEYGLVPLYSARDSRTRHLPFGDEAWVIDPNAMSHILSSAIHFVRAAVVYGVDEDTIDQVVHCIHAHHGPVKEWGSPEAPRTIEALILHQADMLSAGYGATKEKP
jgi:3'-5' exoribonuclease